MLSGIFCTDVLLEQRVPLLYHSVTVVPMRVPRKSRKTSHDHDVIIFLYTQQPSARLKRQRKQIRVRLTLDDTRFCYTWKVPNIKLTCQKIKSHHVLCSSTRSHGCRQHYSETKSRALRYTRQEWTKHRTKLRQVTNFGSVALILRRHLFEATYKQN